MSGWGSCLNAQHEFADAEKVLRKALELKSEDPHARRELGTALIGQKRFADAAAELGMALRLNPEDPWVPGLLKETIKGQENSLADQSLEEQLNLARQPLTVASAIEIPLLKKMSRFCGTSSHPISH